MGSQCRLQRRAACHLPNVLPSPRQASNARTHDHTHPLPCMRACRLEGQSRSIETARKEYETARASFYATPTEDGLKVRRAGGRAAGGGWGHRREGVIWKGMQAALKPAGPACHSAPPPSHSHTHAHTHTHAYTHVHSHSHTRTLTHTYTHTHTHTPHPPPPTHPGRAAGH